jgi:hypothetical protein
MSAWRQKAIEVCPDLRKEFEDPEMTIYEVFFELLPRVRQAHSRGDNDELRLIYAYAEWCFAQKARDLWNSAGVAFYEHLVDNPVTFAAIPQWLSPGVFADVRTLFEARLSPAEYRRLCDAYCEKHGPLDQPRPIHVEGPDDWTV